MLMNPIEVKKKIEELLNQQNVSDFCALVYYNQFKEAVWIDGCTPNQHQRTLCKNVLASALTRLDPVCHGFGPTKTCAIHWTEGIIVVSGNFDTESILKTVVNELRIAV